MSDADMERFWRWRGIETVCNTCRGSGFRLYSNTSTWRGGMGGATVTRDVCDACWGSGDGDNTWTNLREVDARQRAAVAKATLEALAANCGTYLGSMHPAFRELCKELDRLARGRKRPVFFDVACQVLARALRQGCIAAGGERSGEPAGGGDA